MADVSSEQLTVEQFDQGGLRVVVLAGELDVATAEIAEQALEQQLDVLDLSGLEFMDSAGVRILLGICRERDDPQSGVRRGRGPARQSRSARTAAPRACAMDRAAAGRFPDPAPMHAG